MNINSLVAFVLGVFHVAQIKLVGVLLGSDILALCVVPLYLLNKRRLRGLLKERYLFYGLALWFLGAIVTDVYRATPAEDYSRGWSKLVFFALNLSALQLLSGGRFEPLRAAILGGVFGGLLELLFFPSEYQRGGLLDPTTWKFGLGPLLTILAAIVGSYPFTKRFFGPLGVAGPIFILAAANLAMNARSSFGITAVVGLYCLLKAAIDARPQMKRRLSPLVFASFALLGLGAAQGLTAVYAVAAGSGALGVEAKEKYEAQTSGDLSLLQSGRVESVVSLQAIADSPILGHGSWARDIHYVALLVDRLGAAGVTIAGNPFESDLIPSHSHLFGAWVEAGILGGLFWIGVEIAGIMALYRVLKIASAPISLVSYTLFGMFWAVLFSPFGQEQRFWQATNICVVLWVLRAPLSGREGGA
jgi:hypothetical protein